MRFRHSIVAIVTMVAGAALLFHLFQRQLSSVSLAFGSHPQVLSQLEASLDDLKQLADLDGEREDQYRERFEDVETTVHRLQILEHSRDAVRRRFELVTLSIFAVIVVAMSTVYVVRQNRHEPRLARVQDALQRLAGGDTDLELGDRGRDSLGRIARMIERTSKVMARDRSRLRALQNLSGWQEAARRHAHEIRTPLTSSRLGLTRIADLARSDDGAHTSQIAEVAEAGLVEIDRLTRFTRDFTSFARLPEPRFEKLDLDSLVSRFVETYAEAWPALRITHESRLEPVNTFVRADAEMLRQVLVNLAENSAKAAPNDGSSFVLRSSSQGSRVLLDVWDSGPGVPEAIRPTLFEPYTTTRELGEGMGLGLAICRKILLDHGGDLELLRSSKKGAAFRLSFPSSREELL